MASGSSPDSSILVVTEAMDINTDLGSGRARDPDMALICILDPDVTIVPGGNADHPDQHGPWIPTWPQVAVQIPDISMTFDGIRSHEHQHRQWLK